MYNVNLTYFQEKLKTEFVKFHYCIDLKLKFKDFNQATCKQGFPFMLMMNYLQPL